MRALDDYDRKLLTLVQDDADVSTESLATQVNLSSSAVQRRLAALKADGVIERIVAVASPLRLERGLTVVVEVEIDNEQRHVRDQFEKWLRTSPEIQSSWYVTGEADYILVVAVRDLEAYTEFTDRMLAEHALVRKFRSHIGLKTIKRSLKIETG